MNACHEASSDSLHGCLILIRQISPISRAAMTWRPQRHSCSWACMLRCPGCPQVDEPALREGLPLKRARWESYLSWAVRAFRLSTVVADPSTQVVTHLCYSEFADILPVSSLPSATPSGAQN